MSISGKRLCCFIPDQSKLDEGCENPAVFQVWNYFRPNPDAYTESCAEHLEQMLDDADGFIVLRIPEAA